MKSQRILQAHCQSPTSPRTDQSFVKELAKPTREEIHFFFPPFGVLFFCQRTTNDRQVF